MPRRLPDAKTVWLYREPLTRTGAIIRAFERFDTMLRERGDLTTGGQIVDAAVIEARRLRLDAAEKQTRRAGNIPAGWSKPRTRQIDRDGRWTIKRGRKQPRSSDSTSRRMQGEIAIPVFGYKIYIGLTASKASFVVSLSRMPRATMEANSAPYWIARTPPVAHGPCRAEHRSRADRRQNHAGQPRLQHAL